MISLFKESKVVKRNQNSLDKSGSSFFNNSMAQSQSPNAFNYNFNQSANFNQSVNFGGLPSSSSNWFNMSMKGSDLSNKLRNFKKGNNSTKLWTSSAVHSPKHSLNPDEI